MIFLVDTDLNQRKQVIDKILREKGCLFLLKQSGKGRLFSLPTIMKRKVHLMTEKSKKTQTKYNSLAHTKWLCKYHIVIVPKYRRKVIYKEYRKDLQEIIRTLCKYKGVEILEGHMMPDHVHLLLSIPPKTSVSSFMGYLKGKYKLQY